MNTRFLIILLLLIVNGAYGQDFATMAKLQEYSVSFGCTRNQAVDTVLLNARTGKMNIRTSEQLIYLLRAAQSYSIKDYTDSRAYLQKIGGTLRYPEYDNLKLFLLIANYANLRDIENTARHYYIIKKYNYLDPENLNSIHREIRNNFSRADFDYALSYYFYYHQRLKLLNEIGFVESESGALSGF